jgi:hypothetical protein
MIVARVVAAESSDYAENANHQPPRYDYRADSKAYQKFFDGQEARTFKKCKNIMPKPQAA